MKVNVTVLTMISMAISSVFNVMSRRDIEGMKYIISK